MASENFADCSRGKTIQNDRDVIHIMGVHGHFGAKALKIADWSKSCSCTGAVVVTHIDGLDVTGVCGINAHYE
jgi:hypothetical protein